MQATPAEISSSAQLLKVQDSGFYFHLVTHLTTLGSIMLEDSSSSLSEACCFSPSLQGEGWRHRAHPATPWIGLHIGKYGCQCNATPVGFNIWERRKRHLVLSQQNILGLPQSCDRSLPGQRKSCLFAKEWCCCSHQWPLCGNPVAQGAQIFAAGNQDTFSFYPKAIRFFVYMEEWWRRARKKKGGNMSWFMAKREWYRKSGTATVCYCHNLSTAKEDCPRNK